MAFQRCHGRLGVYTSYATPAQTGGGDVKGESLGVTVSSDTTLTAHAPARPHGHTSHHNVNNSEFRVAMGKMGSLQDANGNAEFYGVIQGRYKPRYQGEREGDSARLPTRLGRYTCVCPKGHALFGHTVPDVWEVSDSVSRMEKRRALRSASVAATPDVPRGVSADMALTARLLTAGELVRPGELVDDDGLHPITRGECVRLVDGDEELTFVFTGIAADVALLIPETLGNTKHVLARGSDVSRFDVAVSLRRRAYEAALLTSRLNHQPGLGPGWTSAPTEHQRPLQADSAETYPECMATRADGTKVHAGVTLMPQPFMADCKEQSKRGGMEAQVRAADGLGTRTETPFGMSVADRSGVGLPRGEDELTRSEAVVASRLVGAQLAAAAETGVGTEEEAAEARDLAIRFANRHSGFGLLHLGMNGLSAIAKSTYTADIFDWVPAHLSFSAMDFAKVQGNYPGKKRFVRVLNASVATTLDNAFAASSDRPQPPCAVNGTAIVHVPPGTFPATAKSTVPLAHPGREDVYTEPGAVTLVAGGELVVVLGWRLRRTDPFGSHTGHGSPPATTADAIRHGKEAHALLIRAIKGLRPSDPPVQLYTLLARPADQLGPWPSPFEVARANQR